MTVLVTGCAGFIGFHLAMRLTEAGTPVIGIDNLNAYYDVALKHARLAQLDGRPGFAFHKIDISNPDAVLALVAAQPHITGIIHLAAQAGVRHSLTHPLDYVDANIRGQVVMLEAARRLDRLGNFVYASSSSVYGANRKQPMSVDDRVDQPVSIYAASKRAGELIAESYTRLFSLSCTGLRFFTVYGPWGRPDMAAFLFTDAILAGRPIKVFNEGRMSRDFTYIDDIVGGVIGALAQPRHPGDHRIYNLGNHRPEALLDFIATLERAVGRTAVKQMLPMQPGDVASTYADIEPARRDLGFEPRVPITEGLARFVGWYREYHGIR